MQFHAAKEDNNNLELPFPKAQNGGGSQRPMSAQNRSSQNKSAILQER